MAEPKPPTKPTPVAAAVRHAFKGLRDWVEVFYAGTHVDSKGRTATFTQADLDEMVANVSGAGVPSVIGHPKEADPAYAWSKPTDVKRDGDLLLAKFSDINADFEAGVDSGAYRERSVSVYKDPQRGWVLQHIGWLGAVPPALTGLAPLAYSSAPPADAEAHEFAASDMDAGWALGDVSRLLRGLRDWLIAEQGLDTANAVLPDWTINSVADAGRRIADAALQANAAGLNPLFNRGEPTMPTTITQADLEAAVAQAKKDGAAEVTQQFSGQADRLAQLERERQTERIGTQITGWKTAGLLLPAEEPGLAEFMAALEGGTAAEFKFSASDKSEAKKTPATWFAEFMAKRKALVKLGGGGRAGDETDPPADEGASNKDIAERASAYRSKLESEGRVISIGAAIDAVTAGKDKA